VFSQKLSSLAQSSPPAPPSSPPVEVRERSVEEEVLLRPYNVEWIVDVGRDRIMSDRSRRDNFDCERAVNTAWKSAEKLISHRCVTPRTLSASEPQHKLLYFVRLALSHKRFHILRKELSQASQRASNRRNPGERRASTPIVRSSPAIRPDRSTPSRGDAKKGPHNRSLLMLCVHEQRRGHGLTSRVLLL
jgi:hypothetical protein